MRKEIENNWLCINVEFINLKEKNSLSLLKLAKILFIFKMCITQSFV